MGLGSLFRFKKSKPKKPKPEEKEEKLAEKESDAPPPEIPEEDPPKPPSANVAYPFHAVKATTFPPPLSIDASVFTDPQNLTQTQTEDKNGQSQIEDKSVKEGLQTDGTEKTNEIKSDQITDSTTNGECDSKSCTKKNCKPETCTTIRKQQHESEEKMSPVQLTEMINSSIKEAMQTIVKQCRMEEKKDTDKKSKKELDRPVCYANKEEISMKAKQFGRSRSLRSNVKPACPQEKYNTVRSVLNKSHEDSAKCRVRKEDVENKKSRRHSKPANRVKTDNRKMTGNVNIYICSEATENAQGTAKQKKTSPCAESSSETTTNQSNASSCKLVKCIRKKRRGSQECDSLDLLAKREESSENSNECTCLSNYTNSDVTIKSGSKDIIDACDASDEIITVHDMDSNLIACQCKDVNISNSDVTTDRSNVSVPRSKFVICDKMEPCDTIYPSKTLSSTDSNKWSSKSTCNSVARGSYGQSSEIDKEKVLFDGDGRVGWSRKPKSVSCNYYDNNFARDYNAMEDRNYKMHSKRSVAKPCRCEKKDQELLVNCNAASNYRSKRHRAMEKQDPSQPWSTCSCIVEEEEEDITVCQRTAENLQERPEKCITYNGSFTTLKESSKKEAKKSLDDVETLEGKETRKSVEDGIVKDPIKKDSTAKEAEEMKGETTEQQGEVSSDQRATPTTPFRSPPFRSPRLLRPEARVLKLLLQQGKPATQTAGQESAASPLIKNANTPNESIKNGSDAQTEKKKEPAFLKKFNLPERYRLAASPVKEQTEETIPQETDEKILKNQDSNEKEDQNGEGMKNTPQGKLRQSVLFKAFKKILNKPQQSGGESKKSEEGENNEDASADADTGDKAKTPEPKNNADPLPRKSKTKNKETRKENKNSSKADANKPSVETNGKQENVGALDTVANKENENSVAKGETSMASNSVAKEALKEDKKESISNGANESRYKSNLLASIINKKLTPPSPQTVNAELTKRRTSQGLQKQSGIEGTTKEPQEPVRKSEIPSQDHVKKKTESSEIIAQAETVSKREVAPKAYSNLEKEGTTLCTECSRRRSSSKVLKPATELRYVRPHETESHRVCANSKFTKCSSVNNGFADNEQLRDERCSCCYLPISQCNNETMNYPKSCLKKGNQFCRIDSQESNLLPYHDNRSWEECGCRRAIACNNCCRPRNECSCRVPIICANCCKAKADCSCKTVHKRRDSCRYMKSMFCLYCDNPREKCACRAPIQKCSYCELPIDLCMCEDRKTVCEGRPVLTGPDTDRTMYVTAWKPREEVRRYFSRNLEDHRAESINECCCHKLKPHNSDDLPYQRLSVFSDVMDELQQKMSESSCCARCKEMPCRCNIEADKDERREERKTCCASPKTRRKVVAVCMEKSKDRSLLPNVCCKCDSVQTRNEKPMKMIVPLCCGCKMKPCRCKKSKSSQKKPKAKCYYCKTLPCACITSRERSKPRPCRCADSPCRTKEKEIIPCGKTSTKSKNNEEKVICVR